MDIDTNAEEENSRRVQVHFITKLKPPLKVAPTSIAIPSNLTRLGLSSLHVFYDTPYNRIHDK